MNDAEVIDEILLEFLDEEFQLPPSPIVPRFAAETIPPPREALS